MHGDGPGRPHAAAGSGSGNIRCSGRLPLAAVALALVTVALGIVTESSVLPTGGASAVATGDRTWQESRESGISTRLIPVHYASRDGAGSAAQEGQPEGSRASAGESRSPRLIPVRQREASGRGGSATAPTDDAPSAKDSAGRPELDTSGRSRAADSGRSGSSQASRRDSMGSSASESLVGSGDESHAASAQPSPESYASGGSGMSDCSSQWTPHVASTDTCSPAEWASKYGPPVRRGVVVLGMHRSGTSLITLILSELGGFIGHGKVLSAAPDNPKGFGELREVVKANRALLDSVVPGCDSGSSCWYKAIVGNKWTSAVSASAMRDFLGHAEPVINDLVGIDDCQSAFWLVKDPRMCLTFDKWLPLMSAGGVPPAGLLMFRHPLASARSIVKRDNFDLRFAMAMWVVHNVQAIVHAVAAGVPLVPVDFHELQLNPREVVENAVNSLRKVGVPFPDDTDENLGAVVDDMIEPSFVHTAEDSALDEELREQFPEVATLYAKMKDGSFFPDPQCCSADCDTAETPEVPRGFIDMLEQCHLHTSPKKGCN